MTPSSPAPRRRRAAFLDFDGTLAENGVVPRVQAEAVLRARRAGHAVLLCTGRPGSIVPADVAELFDGLVTSAGGHVRLGADVLRDQRFPAPLARRAVEVLDAHGVVYALEAPEALWCSLANVERLRSRPRPAPTTAPGDRGRGFVDILDAIAVPEDPAATSFAKISLWGSPVTVEQLAAEIGPEIGALPNSISHDDLGSGELHLAEVDKAVGLRVAADALGVPIEDTVAIGDGMNDLAMLREAGTAVAITGSRPEVLAIADLEVPPPAEHGVLTAFERLGML